MRKKEKKKTCRENGEYIALAAYEESRLGGGGLVGGRREGGGKGSYPKRTDRVCERIWVELTTRTAALNNSFRFSLGNNHNFKIESSNLQPRNYVALGGRQCCVVVEGGGAGGLGGGGFKMMGVCFLLRVLRAWVVWVFCAVVFCFFRPFLSFRIANGFLIVFFFNPRTWIE